MRFCWCLDTVQGDGPNRLFFRYLTSIKTRVLPSRAMRSTSPNRLRKLAVMVTTSLVHRKCAAQVSQCRPIVWMVEISQEMEDHRLLNGACLASRNYRRFQSSTDITSFIGSQISSCAKKKRSAGLLCLIKMINECRSVQAKGV